MRDWMREQVSSDVFDLGVEQDKLKAQAALLLRDFGLIPDPSFDEFDTA